MKDYFIPREVSLFKISDLYFSNDVVQVLEVKIMPFFESCFIRHRVNSNWFRN